MTKRKWIGLLMMVPLLVWFACLLIVRPTASEQTAGIWVMAVIPILVVFFKGQDRLSE
jgi:hypothetical protein